MMFNSLNVADIILSRYSRIKISRRGYQLSFLPKSEKWT